MTLDRSTFLDWLDDYCAGALDPERGEAVERYLEAHPEDRREVERQRALRGLFEALPAVPAPADLRSRILAAARDEGGDSGSPRPVAHVVELREREAQKPRSRSARRWLWPAAQVAAALLFVFGGWQMYQRTAREARSPADSAAVRPAAPVEEGVALSRDLPGESPREGTLLKTQPPAAASDSRQKQDAFVYFDQQAGRDEAKDAARPPAPDGAMDHLWMAGMPEAAPEKREKEITALRESASPARFASARENAPESRGVEARRARIAEERFDLPAGQAAAPAAVSAPAPEALDLESRFEQAAPAAPPGDDKSARMAYQGPETGRSAGMAKLWSAEPTPEVRAALGQQQAEFAASASASAPASEAPQWLSPLREAALRHRAREPELAYPDRGVMNWGANLERPIEVWRLRAPSEESAQGVLADLRARGWKVEETGGFAGVTVGDFALQENSTLDVSTSAALASRLAGARDVDAEIPPISSPAPRRFLLAAPPAATVSQGDVWRAHEEEKPEAATLRRQAAAAKPAPAAPAGTASPAPGASPVAGGTGGAIAGYGTFSRAAQPPAAALASASSAPASSSAATEREISEPRVVQFVEIPPPGEIFLEVVIEP